jgi:predicted Zn-dependent protease
LKQYDEALDAIKEAIKLNPADKSFRDEFEKIKTLRNKVKDAEKQAI